jgi:hypothetical protein
MWGKRLVQLSSDGERLSMWIVIACVVESVHIGRASTVED